MASLDKILRRLRIADISQVRLAPVHPVTPLRDVLRLLGSQNRRSVVVAEGGRVRGIFTQRDVLYRVAREDLDPETPIGELLEGTPRTLRPDQLLTEAIEVMVRGSYRQVPLVDEEGQFCGVLSSREIIRFLAEHFPTEVLNLPPRLHQTVRRTEGA